MIRQKTIEQKWTLDSQSKSFYTWHLTSPRRQGKNRKEKKEIKILK